MTTKSWKEQMNLTKLECEVITLKASLDMINDMVNYAIMNFSHDDKETEIRFKSRIHQTYFYIMLIDFLSKPKDFFGEYKNYLERLSDICEEPKLENKEHTDKLKTAVEKFTNWLSETVTIEKRCFPIIELEIDLKIKREDFISICGNINKHNFTQQTRQAKNLQKVFEENKQKISLDKCLVEMESFNEQFFEDILIYHQNTIAEFLNNIRWGIYVYAKEKCETSITYKYDKIDNIYLWEYQYPENVKSELGKEYFWNLMNDVRKPPSIQEFTVNEIFKGKN